jgi:hypothetical protein
MDYFNSQLIQEIPQVFSGDSQLLGQTEGCGTGYFAFRGRCPYFAFQIFFGHVPNSRWILS